MKKHTYQSVLSRLIRQSTIDRASQRLRQRAHLLEPLEPRQLLAIVPLAPLPANDVYLASEDQILVGNVISGTTSGGADASAVAGLPMKVIEVNEQSIVTDNSVATPAGATLVIADNGSFSYDASTSGSLRALDTGSSQQDAFTYTVAPDFSQLFVFGDSLSDQGRLFAATNQQFPPDPPYFQGRISNGPVWIEEMAGRLDLPLSLVNNFSVAGATTSSANYNESILGTDLPGLADELQQYLAGLNERPADPNALYVVWAGANDFFLPFNDPTVVIGQAVTNLATTVGTLQAVGAKHILVVNLPDLGLTPYAQSIGQTAQLTALSAAFNSALQDTLAGPGLRATFIDMFSTFQNVAANPATFGLTNATDACFNGAAVVGNPANYLFWDSVHPTAAGHQLIAEAVLDAISSEVNVAINVAGATTTPILTLQNAPGVAARSLQLQLSASDASPADQAASFAYVINWGDGSPTQTVTGSAAGAVAEHTYATGAVKQVSVFVRDQDGDVSSTLHEVITWGTQGNDRIDLVNSGSNIRVFAGGRSLATRNTNSVDRFVVFGLGGNDWISAIGLNKRVELHGGAGHDVLLGGNASDILRGDGGNDFLYGLDGHDLLQGEAGSDFLFGDNGNDALDGGAGSDFLFGGNGNDTLDGGAGNDYLFGQAGDDWLIGGLDLDWLIDFEGRNRRQHTRR